jgi:hypothetical protein
MRRTGAGNGAAVCAALALGLALGAAGARAAVRVELRAAEVGAEAKKPFKYVIWIDGPRLAAELKRRDGSPAQRRIVFRADEDRAWLVDLARKTYYQVDPQAAQQVAGQVAGLRKGLESGLESLTPEQREAARELLGELAKPPEKPPGEVSLRERGEVARYADTPCARHDVLEGARRLAEVCLADYGRAPLTREAVAAVPALGGFLRRTLEPLTREFPTLQELAPFAVLDRVDGFPLAVQSFDEGGPTRETIVTKIEQAPADPALFELPTGFARSWIPPFR